MSMSESARAATATSWLASPTSARVGAWVERTRLIDRLSTAADVPVVVVSGPAGSGKSTLVRQWLRADGRQGVEIAGSSSLDDAASLARALVEALERIGPEAPDTRASIVSQEPAWSSIVLPALARLAATRMCDFVLVIDDIHLLPHPACAEAITAVVHAVPAGSRVILVSREESPRFLAGTRAAGRLVELEPADLAFDRDEAAALFDGLAVSVTQDELTDALEHAEGWAVGLYLHALSLQEHGSPGSGGDRSSRRGSDGFVFDYIGTHILDRLDPQSRHFLTRTAVLDELTPEACDAILGRTDSVAVLPRLGEQIQLVIPLDGSGRRFRYHHLFHEALLRELVREAPEELVAVHGRAARWYAEAGDRDSAIRHAKATGDRGLIADMIWPGVASCLATGSLDRVAGWLRGIPEHDVLHEPRLTLAEAWLALEMGNATVMDRWLLHAESQAGKDWRDRANTDELAATLACAVALVGRDGLADSVALCVAAGRGLPPDSGFRAPAAFILGVCLTLRRDVTAGLASLLSAERAARALDQPLLVADSLSWQGLLAFAAGDQRTGSQLILAASDIIRDHHLERLATSAHCVTAQALVLALQRDPSAISMLGTARRLTAHTEGIAPWFAVCGRLIQAQAAVALRDGSLARLLISEAKALMTEDLSDSLASDFLAGAEASLAMLSIDGVSAATLSPAELRVLQFLPSHLSFPQISEHLFLSPNTVKSHSLAIYRKFGVTSRDAAVERAQRLGLVESPPRD